MSIEQLKREVTALNDRERADLICFTLRLRHEHDADYHREVTDRLNDNDKSRWLTPDDFERRLGNA
ncbi:MAG: hypothetical protein ACREDS_13210 [Limisphaerales bacterium]